MQQLTKENVLTTDNSYLEQLKNHYGDKLNLDDVSVLYFSLVGDFEDDDYKFYTIIFIVKDGLKVEYVKVFGIGDKCTLGVDLSIDDITDIEGLKKIVKYGTNFKSWHFQDINLYEED